MLYNFLTALGKKIAWNSRRPVLLLASDLSAIFIPALLIILIRAIFYPDELQLNLSVLPILFLAPALYYFDGLYDSVMPPFPQEMHKLGIGLSLAYLAMGIVIFFGRADLPSRLVIVIAWFLSLALLPIFRVFMRKHFASRLWWTRPVIIFGSPQDAAGLVQFLHFSPQTGLRPEALVCTSQNQNIPFVTARLPILKSSAEVKEFSTQYPDAYAIILNDNFERSTLRELMEQAGRLFPSVLLVLNQTSSDLPMWLRPVEIAHTMALESKQNLFDKRRIFIKRSADLICSVLGGLAILPLLIGLALWIKIESPGPIFFRHKRLGLNGKHFNVLKFRTMIINAEEVLQGYLKNNPELQKEWDEDHKLRNDPRVTKVGEFLRRTSLDELPQIFNVIMGEMSLVGPRPIVDAEIPKYAEAYANYIRVRPGMTGLWQVSGRNDTSYTYRIRMDCYYISNWSIWMDIWILARTPMIVLKGSGAY